MRGKKDNFDAANDELEDSNNIDDFGHDFYEKMQNERRLLNEFGRLYGLDTQLPNEFSSDPVSDDKGSAEEDDGMGMA